MGLGASRAGGGRDRANVVDHAHLYPLWSTNTIPLHGLSIRLQLQARTMRKRLHALVTNPMLKLWVSSPPAKNSRTHTFNMTPQRYSWI